MGTSNVSLRALSGPMFHWTSAGGGLWSEPTNWSPQGTPNGNDVSVVLSGSSQSATIIPIQSSTTIRKIKLDGSSQYQLSGSSNLRFDSNVGEAELMVSGGQHTWTTAVKAVTDTTVDIASEAELTLAGEFDFQDATITKTGLGTLLVDGAVVTQGGQLDVSEGTVGGNGIINGNVNHNGGVISPGQGVGELNITGGYTMNPDATLRIDIAGPSNGEYDVLNVTGLAGLSGELEPVLADGYTPAESSLFLVLTASEIFDAGLSLAGPHADRFELVAGGANGLILRALSGPTFHWSSAGGGFWHAPTNWSPQGIPDGNDVSVVLSGSTQTVTTIAIYAPTTIREITVDGSSQYRLTGSNNLRFDSNDGEAELMVSGGQHTWTTAVKALADTTVDIAPDAELTLAGEFDFQDATITKTGLGTLLVDGSVVTQGGQLDVNEGTVGGNGIISGNVTHHGGVINPGQGVGELNITGGYTMNPNATLKIDIAGPSSGEYDVLNVTGFAGLSGELEPVLADGYSPAAGLQFPVLTAPAVFIFGLSLTGPHADRFELVTGGSGGVILMATSPPGLPGDYNADGRVDAADYLVWRQNLGASVVLPNDTTPGEVSQVDYEIWKANYGQVVISGSAESTLVPEPATLWLIGIMLTGAVGWSSKRDFRPRISRPAFFRRSAEFIP